MGQTCPACHSELQALGKQRYCSSCAEPIDVEVDREEIRRETTGFLAETERSRIIDSINDSSATHHEYTHVRVQEEVRHALRDFLLLANWDNLDNREALLGDLVRDTPSEPGGTDDLLDTRGLAALFRLLCTSMRLEAIEHLFELALRTEIAEQENVGYGDISEVNVELRINDTAVEELEREFWEVDQGSDED
ncbi:hypothetical protein [Haloarcula amylolytica]|uniref:hypothetical protein n=1 Tax=Haloarcula amylolytica TaxID=396317 RepID=UPI003C77C0A1